MVEKKAFLANPTINIMYPNAENKIIVPITKIMEVIMSIEVCPIPWVNVDYKKNDGRKSFSCKSKASISFLPMGKTQL